MGRWSVWVGRVLSALPVLAMLFSATFKFRAPAEVVQIFTGKFGYPPQTLTPLGVVELSCAVLYAIPQTAVLGALLMTGYLGGAVATHVRVSDVWLPPAVLGVVAWVGLYLREPRLRDLLPLRRLPRQSGNP
ncbi:MAG TPA: DoxX family protein [Myxococcales bacterium]